MKQLHVTYVEGKRITKDYFASYFVSEDGTTWKCEDTMSFEDGDVPPIDTISQPGKEMVELIDGSDAHTFAFMEDATS